MRVPVFSGPLVHNFKAIIQDLVENQAIEIVDNGEDLINKIIVLHQNPEKKNQLIENASHILDSNKGALIRYVTKIEELLS
jgi:3-deoxy-D-manno-octulosonic-acid transferase